MSLIDSKPLLRHLSGAISAIIDAITPLPLPRHLHPFHSLTRVEEAVLAGPPQSSLSRGWHTLPPLLFPSPILSA